MSYVHGILRNHVDSAERRFQPRRVTLLLGVPDRSGKCLYQARDNWSEYLCSRIS